jgi:hypothetical protein
MKVYVHRRQRPRTKPSTRMVDHHVATNPKIVTPSGVAILGLTGQSGGRGIRTHVGCNPKAVFKTAAIGH